MKRNILVVSGAAVVALGAYLLLGGIDKDTPSAQDTTDIKQLVQEYSSSSLENLSASITSEQLIVTDSNNKEKTYDLPKDEFFVSIAPYVENTHPCATHSLTGCQGELTDDEFKVYIEDSEGNVIVDQEMKSLSNGFIDLWLPRDKKYNVTIEQDGKAAKSELSTFKSDNTCVTTMQLAENI
ncbi:CueP family metal-binding protein [Paenibacillus sp. FSL R10-2796]|uniref:CueP family metal-binding protein n=1 Tax=Paenibacillus TaxID=44249 RepID=UPI0020BFF439|nr:CueP family metal-binding protein [Paenibacillus odorifer]